MFRIKFVILSILMLAMNSRCFSASIERVNILTWWGYLAPTDLLSVEKKCGAKISVDEYFSNSEFLRRWDNKKQTHEIVLFSNTIYNLIDQSLRNQNFESADFEPYDSSLKTKIDHLHLKRGTRVFLLSLTGFVWDKSKIQIDVSKPLNQFLKNVDNRMFVIMDDAVEGLDLLDKMNLYSSSQKLNVAEIEKHKLKILISNDLEKLIGNKKFSFSYFWSGGSLKEIAKNKGIYSFTVHPEFSHVTADLISLVKSTPGARCVYKSLSSKSFIREIASKTYYFSPFGASGDQFFENYFPELAKLKWLESPTINEFVLMDESWKKLKLQLNK
jgi:hypothetical protein